MARKGMHSSQNRHSMHASASIDRTENTASNPPLISLWKLRKQRQRSAVQKMRLARSGTPACITNDASLFAEAYIGTLSGHDAGVTCNMNDSASAHKLAGQKDSRNTSAGRKCHTVQDLVTLLSSSYCMNAKESMSKHCCFQSLRHEGL